ncbi:proteasome endopeptidase complex, beta subunit [Cryphonectria parasitica EP155]|uniref:Proteasome subunit beta n=1 Tax=Cryphonectria parasitica (strain ATCC 38755 / EP155) TaxID=660469 RepID=A0A9P5CT63_CRYP1|nr:proteasome endopeptidase complex, beta subunit [Cryphonectria parasitica EP155]KAF3769337.1 proteasome endopeptidase complex, beta subunit [Cryphonectria parasitica EP155]
MDHRPQAWGRPRDDVYGAYDHSYLTSHGPKTATQSPAVTGTSVLGLKFRDGVVLAADNLASYGSLARFNDVKRVRAFAGTSAVGFSGDVSDMQYLDRHLNELEIDEAYEGNFSAAQAAGEIETDEDKKAASRGGLSAANLHKYLAKLLYARRNKFNPLWNQLLVAGFDDEHKPFLAAADLRGTVFSSPSLATGFGSMLAQPIMRKYAATEEDAAKLTKEQAVEVVRECMKVLYYRDARSWDGYSLAVVTKEGVDVSFDEKLENQSWAFADRIKGYGTQTV